MDDRRGQHTARELEHELTVLLRRVRRVTGERARMIHPDLSPVAYSMLVAIHEHGARRASELAETFTLDKGAVSRQVAQLESLGLVTRSADPDDGRAQQVSITVAAARQLAEVDKARHDAFVSKVENGLSSYELETLVALLGRYNRAIEPDVVA